ncbi:MAG: hypothetical protein OEZ51_11150 [Nitrospinota bacterium]|nr:hypothetical protein [Nitrospinota bacterium]
MEAILSQMQQLQFSLTTSQMIISFGILALGAIWGRTRTGVLLSLGTCAYWEYTANKTVLFQIAVANVYSIFWTLFIGFFLGFLLVYAFCLPSSSR